MSRADGFAVVLGSWQASLLNASSLGANIPVAKMCRLHRCFMFRLFISHHKQTRVAILRTEAEGKTSAALLPHTLTLRRGSSSFFPPLPQNAEVFLFVLFFRGGIEDSCRR